MLSFKFKLLAGIAKLKLLDKKINQSTKGRLTIRASELNCQCKTISPSLFHKTDMKIFNNVLAQKQCDTRRHDDKIDV